VSDRVAPDVAAHAAGLTRRQLLGAAALGVGPAALASLLARETEASVTAASGGLPGLPHHPPKARRIVMLWQGGGPSHVDLFDPKPTLIARGGEEIPASVRGSTRLSTMSSGYAKWPVVSPIRPFRRYGRSGIEMSELIPRMGSLADDLCLVRSLQSEAVNHAGRRCPAGRAWAPGWPTDSAAKPTTCRRSW